MQAGTAASRAVRAAAACLVAAALAACGMTINHAHDPTARFVDLKTYAWDPASALTPRDSLVETNVRFVADPLLEQKGFTRSAGKADFVVVMQYESETLGGPRYALRVLTLRVHQAGSQALLWQGTASGTISTDASSDDLRKAVQGILASFPPK